MLTVYRASAGAGKTHKLTGEYLKLLFTHPGAYRRILAVTFTNKATDEMKSRIVEELFLLSSGRKSSFVELLTVTRSLSEEAVRKEAKRILIRILHDYAAFNISTIDRFFQQTMRAFTREIGLQGGYGIEMDQTLVLTEAVDNLLAGLEKPDNKELLNWLLRFAEEKIENGGEWNLRREIMILGQELFKENYKAFSADVAADLENKQALEDYKDELNKIVRSVEAEARRLGEKGINLMDQYGLQPSDFKGGSRSSMSFFGKLAKGEMKEPSATFCGFADNPEGCYTKTTPPSVQQIISCVMDDGLNDCIKAVLALFSDLTAYYTAREITRYYYTLGILTDISRQIASYREEKNILLIADTTELLNKIIAGSETPFIYEKTGTRIDHYMIDEFQDTSKMQWANFRPLLKESLAHACDNLIVGDVKQSIYRFRNSDWTLLDSQVQQDFSPAELEEETLRENWRSCRHIVDFNNAFFTAAPHLLQNQYNEQVEASSLSGDEQEEFTSRIHEAYDGSTQLTPDQLSGQTGHVQITFLPQEDADWKEESLKRLPETLERLQDNGYRLKDIAILVRTNLEGASVAGMLLDYKEAHPGSIYKYNIISDDALFVNSSPAVRFIVAVLKHLRNREDRTNRQMALFSYIALLDNFEEETRISSFPDTTEKALQELSRHSLYEMTEGIYRLFAEKFPVNEQVFIQAFLDLVLEFSQKENADIGRFLKWWDDAGYRKTITTPDDQDAIRIMTIHKSKGLGFKAVIMPFGDWEIDHKPTKSVILWCRPASAPFDKLHLVPVRYGQILAKTYFAKDYFKEKLHAFIDNLNTLYVAFTRAKEELIVFAPKPKKIDESGAGLIRANSIAELLWMGLFNETPGHTSAISLSSTFQPEDGLFQLGDWHKTSQKQEVTATQELQAGGFRSVSSQDRLHLRLQGKNLYFDDTQRKHGALMHDLLSRIRTTEDISPAVESYYLGGVISRTEAEELKVRLDNLLTHDSVRRWYDGSSLVLNETDILFGNGLSRRPDRIIFRNGEVDVVDYKFGGIEEGKYEKQMKTYLDLIKQIGYKDVYGYIWYVELDKLACVND